MKLKYRYVMKHIAFQVAPTFLIISAMASAVIWMVSTNNSTFELIIAIVISTVVLMSFLIYFSCNITKFLHMIKMQENKYGISFNDLNAKMLGNRFSVWIICSDSWLICPGKFAIYREEITSASIAEYSAQKGGGVYPVRIRILSGKTYKIKLKSENDARFLRKWART